MQKIGNSSRIGFKVLLTAMVMAWAVGATASDNGWQDLLKASDLSAWREPLGEWKIVGEIAKDGQDGKKLTCKAGAGVILNGDKGKAKDLISKEEFGDVEIHLEFIIPEKSNSGVYIMGRYEIQVYDSFGVEKDKYPGIECGGIYPRWINGQNAEGHSPVVNASLAPGQWQSYDISFRAPRFDGSSNKVANAVVVKVVHNGKVVHENVELTGPTRGGYDGEKAVGPLRLQGDHGPVAYRNIRVRPLSASAKTVSAPNQFFAMDTCAPTGQMPLLKDLGYSGFSWRPGADIGQVVKDAAALNLKVYSVYAGLSLNTNALSGDHSAVIASLKDTGVMIWLPINSKAYKPSSEEGDAVAVPALQAMADNAASNGVKIALYPHTGCWVEKVQDAVRVAKKVNRPNFGVTFNLCHCLMVGDEDKIPQLLTEAMPYLFLVSINGADSGAGRTSWARLIRPLDEGSLDVLPVLKKLRELGYAGPIGLQGFGVKLPPGENLTRSSQAWKKYCEKL